MTAHEILEVVTIAFNPSLQPSPSEPPLAYAAVAAQLKAAPGVQAVYVGRQLERPSLWTVFIRWSRQADYDAFVASEAFLPWLASLKALLIDDESAEGKTLPPRHAPFKVTAAGGSFEAPLEAPTTEVFSCYGVEDGFLERNLRPFAEGLDGGAIPGYHGLAYGGYVSQGGGQPEGDTTGLFIGWDSKEAHLAQRGEDKGEIYQVLLPCCVLCAVG